MQNSDLTITVKAVGIPEAEAQLQKLGATMTKLTVNQNGTVTASGKLTSALNAQNNATNSAANATNRASKAQESYFGHIAKTTVQSALINKLFLELVDVAGQAVKQVDLMNNFPATMASMGQSTAASTEAFKALRDYVGQVGGNLGDAASAVTRFTGVTNDVKAAVAVYTGLNNALIAGDSSLEEQRLSAIQFAQAFERGKPDMKEWLSLTTNMSQQLGIVAKEMGYVSASSLGEALRNGEESMGTFTAKLTELSTGTGPIAQQAMARMSGMQFAFNVLKNTLVQGLATIINAFGRSNIVSFFTFLTQVIQVLTSWVITLINWLGNLANMISSLFGGGKVFQGIQGDAVKVGEALNTGAKGADDMGKGLDKAGKKAKELQKGLAGFDKMNVLADKTSGSGGDSGGGAGGSGTSFSPSEMGSLTDAFGNIVPDLKEASMLAKIFAGILTGLAANSLIKKLFGVNPLGELIKGLSKATVEAGKLGGKLAVSGAKAGAKTGADFAAGVGKSIGDGLAKLAPVVGGFLAGLAAAAGSAVSGALGALGTTIATAISGAVIAGAAALGVSVGVFIAIIAVAVAAIVAIVWLIASNWDTIVRFMTDVFNNFIGFVTGVWNTLYNIFEGPVKFIGQFVEATFTLIVAIIAIALELIFKLVVATVQLIFDVLATIANWIFKNVIEPVAKFFKGLWDGIVKLVTDSWNWILNNVLLPVAGWINTNVIQPISKFFQSLWTTVTGFVNGFITGFYNTFRPFIDWIVNNVINPIARFFQGLWDGITNGLRNMINGLGQIFGNLANIAKAPINGLIDVFNGLLRKLNTIKVPDWVPGFGGKGVNFPMIPKLAKGGVVDRATMAILGEAGTEAIVPLENNTEWVDKVASLLNQAGGGGQPLQLTVQIGEEKIASKVIELINEKTQMSGRNTIYV